MSYGAKNTVHFSAAYKHNPYILSENSRDERNHLILEHWSDMEKPDHYEIPPLPGYPMFSFSPTVLSETVQG